MARYLQFDSNNFDYVVRADFSIRKEYFEEFTWATTRDKSVYGLTRITPEVTFEYDLNGLKFLYYCLGSVSPAIGSIPATITPSDTLPEIDIKASIDTYKFSVLNAKVDTWELTIEEGTPVRMEVTVRGRNYDTATGASSYSPDLSALPLMIHQCTITVGGSTLTFGRFTLRGNNNLDPEFKTSTLPLRYKERGLEVTGRVRLQQWTIPPEGEMVVILGDIGSITLANIKWTEIPPRARGWDFPENELSFVAYATATAPKIQVVASVDKW